MRKSCLFGQLYVLFVISICSFGFLPFRFRGHDLGSDFCQFLVIAYLLLSIMNFVGKRNEYYEICHLLTKGKSFLHKYSAYGAYIVQSAVFLSYYRKTIFLDI